MTEEDLEPNSSRDTFLIISTVVVISAYMMFLLSLRIFEKYAAMVNVIIYVVKGSAMFLIIFTIITFAFGNMFFIMGMLDDIDTYD